MGETNKSVEMQPQQGDVQPNGLTKHQQNIIDYALMANRAQTEEIVTRTQHHVRTEINSKFEQYTKITTARKITMAVGAVLAFGAGWLAKKLLTPDMDEGPNHVED